MPLMSAFVLSYAAHAHKLNRELVFDVLHHFSVYQFSTGYTFAYVNISQKGGS